LVNWTSKNVEILRELTEAGMSDAAIGAHFRVSEVAIRVARHRLGIRRPGRSGAAVDVPGEDIQEIRMECGVIGGPTYTWARIFKKGDAYLGQITYDQDGNVTGIHGDPPIGGI